MLPNGRLELSARVGSLEFQQIDWGISVEALSGIEVATDEAPPGIGVATDLTVTGALHKDETPGRFMIDEENPLRIGIASLRVLGFRVTWPNELTAIIDVPVLRGIEVSLARGALPSIQVDSGERDGDPPVRR